MMNNKREHVRLVPAREEEFRLLVSVEGAVVDAKLVDYSAFGMGALVPYSEGTLESFRVGRVFALQCVLGDSRFPSRGKVANASRLDDEQGSWLRIGFALVSEATPVRERLSQRRAELRLEVDAHLSPLCVCEDDLWYGSRVFLRARDVSVGGFALELPSDRVPFLPKQRVWLRVLLPFFGEFKAYVRIAYVKKIPVEANMASPQGAPFVTHLVGVTSLRSVSDVSAVLCDYLYFTHGEFEMHDLREAGFDVSHLGGVDSTQRARIVRSQGSDSWNVDEIEFHVENSQGDAIAKGALALEAGGSRFVLKAFANEGGGTLVSLLRFLVLFGNAHACETLSLSPEARKGLREIWPNAPESMMFPSALASHIPVRTLLALSPLFRKRIDAPPGPRGTLLKALGSMASVLDV
ncbi:MAG: PilZ domain-containing protein [Silvanigrellales bacterium]|jgi:hypothetical protein|nr:PilZ domain-containing protein [Silvanigrellales bacterium]